ncbi:hypothetical protein [Actinoplanes palleronii]|nr:hypothetical protein [Actinoplanes palleronii]
MATFRADDGVEIFYEVWESESALPCRRCATRDSSRRWWSS